MTPATTPEDGMPQQDARFAIDGAIAYGRMGTNEPPAGHWLTEYWHIGRQLAKLGETSAWDNQAPVDAPSLSPSAITDGQITELAEPYWLKDAQKPGEFFDTNKFARVLLALATPSPGKAEPGEDTRTLLTAASHALRSYQYGNASPDLAESIADRIDAALRASNEGNA